MADTVSGCLRKMANDSDVDKELAIRTVDDAQQRTKELRVKLRHLQGECAMCHLKFVEGRAGSQTPPNIFSSALLTCCTCPAIAG